MSQVSNHFLNGNLRMATVTNFLKCRHLNGVDEDHFGRDCILGQSSQESTVRDGFCVSHWHEGRRAVDKDTGVI